MITDAPVRRASARALSANGASAPDRLRRDLVRLTVGAAVALAAALALSATTGLWLDEAQSVAIARLPVGDLLRALRHDGAPPLYYLLLHGWMKAFGTGDIAVRSLSALFALATVPVTALAARRMVGQRAAVLAGVVMATMPFLHRYGTETRMYAVVMLLVSVGWLVGHRAWRNPTLPNLAGVGLVSGLLILTQYWALFLIVAAVGLCLWKRHWRLFAAIAAGGVLFLPWLPSFLYQSAHTGAPWGARADLGVYEITVRGFAGGPGRLGALGMTYLLLAVLAVVGRPGEDGSVVLDVRGTVQGRRLAMAAIVPLSLAMALSYATKAAFAVRYSAIVLVPFVFLVVHGLELVRPAYAMRWVLAFALVFAVVRSGVEAHMQRTQAVQVAHVLNAQAKPGDLVVFCPDQLGPAVTRLLHAPVTTSAYPAGDSGQVVDWVDYQARNKAAQPGAFAERAVAQAPSGAVWVVFANGYRTFGASCANLWDRLDDLRPGAKRLVKPLKKSIEKASLWRFSAPSRGNP